MIPTEKASILQMTAGELKSHSKLFPPNVPNIPYERFINPNKNYHLYILSDDKIKEDDYYLVELFNIKGESTGIHVEQCKSINDIWVNNQGDYYKDTTRHIDNCKKIIATTDSSLELEPYQGHYEGIDCTNYFPSIPQQFIDKYVSEYNKGNKIEEVMVEYYPTWVDVPGYPKPFKEAKLEDAILTLKLNPGNYINIKPVKDSWTRDEVKQLLIDCCSEVSSIDGTLKEKNLAELYTSSSCNSYRTWIEQNL